ncbi:hypothetical protein ACSX1A_01150 [Pontibacter sp. MBLB2868]|uniref:hypothetical protein n=1 Tax=Pontibacter sp. MBLB2868 TaxID=3451555 RepID=UPI003F74F466
MTRFWLIIICLGFTISAAYSQAKALDNITLKAGVGPILLIANENTWRQNVMVGAVEGELTKTLHRVISVSGVLDLGHGKRTSMVSSDVDYHAFMTQISGNVFVSPFGNDRRYNLKIGTGAALMFMADKFTGENLENRDANKILTPGVNLILANEFAVSERSLIGLKTIVQGFSSGDFTGGVLFTYGIRL